MKWEILNVCVSLRQPATLAGNHGSTTIVECREDDQLHAFGEKERGKRID